MQQHGWVLNHMLSWGREDKNTIQFHLYDILKRIANRTRTVVCKELRTEKNKDLLQRDIRIFGG